MEGEKELSQDESRRAQSDLQQLTDSFVAQMDEMKKEKETEVMEV
jgi:ribosome recycling factor